MGRGGGGILPGGRGGLSGTAQKLRREGGSPRESRGPREPEGEREMVRRSTTKAAVAAAAVAALALGARAEEAAAANATDAAAAANATDAAAPAAAGGPSLESLASQVDFSTLASDPTQLLTLLPQMGFSAACQQGVIGAGATCMADFQAVGALFSNPDIQAKISKITGVDVSGVASAAAGGNVTESDVTEQLDAAPTLSEDQISELVDALLPEAQKALPTKDADGNGMISAQCCTQMEPLVTENCMCTETAMTIIYDGLKSRGITDLNPYGKLIAGVMDKLSCTALNNLVFYPSSECPASRRLALF